jgi:hypothetical protein
VRVAVKSHGYAGEPEEVLDQFRVDATPQKEGGARMPEVVPADKGGPARLRSGLKWRLTMFWASRGVPLRVAKTRSESL